MVHSHYIPCDGLATVSIDDLSNAARRPTSAHVSIAKASAKFITQSTDEISDRCGELLEEGAYEKALPYAYELHNRLKGGGHAMELQEIIARITVADCATRVAQSSNAKEDIKGALGYLLLAEEFSCEGIGQDGEMNRRRLIIRSRMFNCYAFCRKKQGQLTTALKYCERALNILLHFNEEEELPQCYLNLCALYNAMELHAEALKYGLLALQIVKGMLTRLTAEHSEDTSPFVMPSVEHVISRSQPGSNIKDIQMTPEIINWGSVLAVTYFNIAVSQEKIGKSSKYIQTYRLAKLTAEDFLGVENPTAVHFRKQYVRAKNQAGSLNGSASSAQLHNSAMRIAAANASKLTARPVSMEGSRLHHRPIHTKKRDYAILVPSASLLGASMVYNAPLKVKFPEQDPDRQLSVSAISAPPSREKSRELPSFDELGSEVRNRTFDSMKARPVSRQEQQRKLMKASTKAAHYVTQSELKLLEEIIASGEPVEQQFHAELQGFNTLKRKHEYQHNLFLKKRLEMDRVLEGDVESEALRLKMYEEEARLIEQIRRKWGEKYSAAEFLDDKSKISGLGHAFQEDIFSGGTKTTKAEQSSQQERQLQLLLSAIETSNQPFEEDASDAFCPPPSPNAAYVLPALAGASRKTHSLYVAESILAAATNPMTREAMERTIARLADWTKGIESPKNGVNTGDMQSLG